MRRGAPAACDRDDGLAHCARDLVRELAALVAREPRPHATDRLLEALAIERFEKVVDRVAVERFERVLLVGRDEHHERTLSLQSLQHTEAVRPAHLHVEQQQIGLHRFDLLDGFEPVRRLADDREVGLERAQLAQPFARVRLVVDDDCSDAHVDFAQGMRTRARTEPSASCVRSNS